MRILILLLFIICSCSVSIPSTDDAFDYNSIGTVIGKIQSNPIEALSYSFQLPNGTHIQDTVSSSSVVKYYMWVHVTDSHYEKFFVGESIFKEFLIGDKVEISYAGVTREERFIWGTRESSYSILKTISKGSSL